jgi:inosose dehydratase
VDVSAIVGALEDSGYAGWYVLEQDTILDGDPGDQSGDQKGSRPVDDVETSLDFLLGLAAQHSGVGI